MLIRFSPKSSGLFSLALLLFFSVLAGSASAQVPPNDVCANAIPLTMNSGWVAAFNTGTVTNGPNPNCGGTTLIRDVW